MRVRRITDNCVIDVTQATAGSDYFIDKNRNPYKVSELDFNVSCPEPQESDFPYRLVEVLDNASDKMTKEQRDYDTETYFRELSGNLLLSLIEKMSNADINPYSLGCRLEWTKNLIERLRQ